MNPETDLRPEIREEARRLGFSHCGFAKPLLPDAFRERYTGVIRRGEHEPFTYLATSLEKRLNPELLLPGIKTVMALLMGYYPAHPLPETDNYIMARYGIGADYHVVIRERMKRLCEYLNTRAPGSSSCSFVDSGPVAEKAWAEACGVGWQGKNTLLIHPKEGSFFFIGIVFTTLDLPEDPRGTDRCGSCTRCVDACPTGALDTPYRLNIRRCIAYHTIENKGEIPGEIQRSTGARIFGCDTCQDVCPYNRFAAARADNPFEPSPELRSMTRSDWEALTREDFHRLFSGTAVLRRGFAMFRRNIGVAAAGGQLPQR